MTDLISTTNQLDQTITDIAGQLAPSSKRVYLNDTKHFADWMNRQAITPDSISRSDMIAYRLHLAESTYAKATKQRMIPYRSLRVTYLLQIQGESMGSIPP